MEAHLREVRNPTSWHTCCIQLAEARAQSPEEVKTARETQAPCHPGRSGSVWASTCIWLGAFLVDVSTSEASAAEMEVLFTDKWE